MRTAALDDVVRRHLAGRSEVSMLKSAGLSGSVLRNLRRMKSMPSPGAIERIAEALGTAPEIVTRALLKDRGYNLGAPADDDLEELGVFMRSATKATRRLLVGVAELLRNEGLREDAAS